MYYNTNHFKKKIILIISNLFIRYYHTESRTETNKQNNTSILGDFIRKSRNANEYYKRKETLYWYIYIICFSFGRVMINCSFSLASVQLN